LPVFRYILTRCAKHEPDTILILTSVATAPSQLGPHQNFPSQFHSANPTQWVEWNSSVTLRAMPNGTGPRPQRQTGGPPAAGLPSPRLEYHNNQSPGLPPPQVSMPPTMSMWPSYYMSPSHLFCIALMYCELSTRTINAMCIGIRLCPCKHILNINLHKGNLSHHPSMPMSNPSAKIYSLRL
jgi:hypothetical protein